MTSEEQPSESGLLKSLQLSSEKHGFQFYINPPRNLVPPFLAGYQPDAIARRPDGGGVIIEVKRGGSRASNRQLSEIAKVVSAQKGWELQVIYVNAATEAPLDFAKPTYEQIEVRLTELEALTKAEYRAPALILGWAVLESLARLASAGSGVGRSGGFSPIQAVQTLAEHGYLENDVAQNLREMAKLRNTVVHGDFSIDIPAEQVELLLKQLKAIASDIMTVPL